MPSVQALSQQPPGHLRVVFRIEPRRCLGFFFFHCDGYASVRPDIDTLDFPASIDDASNRASDVSFGKSGF
jgi:hypothetical protein